MSQNLSQYWPQAQFRPGVWQPCQTAHSFSGAKLWRSINQGLALKCWPSSMTPDRLRAIHSQLRLAAQDGMTNLSLPLTGIDGSTILFDGQHCWELSPWLAGTVADMGAISATMAMESVEHLVRLHRAWSKHRTTNQQIPGVQRRLAIINDFRTIYLEAIPGESSNWQQIRQIIREQLMETSTVLATITNWVAPLQWCWCDPWRGNLLFSGEGLTAWLDHGAVKLDHPAIDLARLAGSLAGADQDIFQAMLEKYASLVAFSKDDLDKTSILDRSGIVCASLAWLRRRYLGQIDSQERKLAAESRIAELLLALKRTTPCN